MFYLSREALKELLLLDFSPPPRAASLLTRFYLVAGRTLSDAERLGRSSRGSEAVASLRDTSAVTAGREQTRSPWIASVLT